MRDLFHFHRLRPTLVACALMAPALLGSSVSHADTCRPWHVELSAQYTNSRLEADNRTFAEAVGSGYASYIGAIRAVGLSYASPPENGTVVIDGTGTLTGLNGDQIFVSFDGAVLDVATGEGTGVYVVNGGRGRFEGATGHASLSFSFLAPNGFALVADGTLCF